MSMYAVNVPAVLDSGHCVRSAADELAHARVAPAMEPLASALTGSVSAEVASRLAALLDGRLALLHQALAALGDGLVAAGEAYDACEDTATVRSSGRCGGGAPGAEAGRLVRRGGAYAAWCGVSGAFVTPRWRGPAPALAPAGPLRDREGVVRGHWTKPARSSGDRAQRRDVRAPGPAGSTPTCSHARATALLSSPSAP